MNTEAEKQNADGAPNRRRGRPTGKNRVPLSLEERRARNAFYERERRNQTADAISELAESVGCHPNIATADLLATVISHIQRETNKNSTESISDFTRINENLELQISMLQERLGLSSEDLDKLDDEGYEAIEPHSSQDSPCSSNMRNEKHSRKQANTLSNTKPKKRKRSEHSKSKSSKLPPGKRAKTRSEASTDSGLGSQNQCISPSDICIEDIQYLVQSEQQQLPIDIFETDDLSISQTPTELQTELYNQICSSNTQNPENQLPEWNSANLLQPPMESPGHSLIVVPSALSLEESTTLYLPYPTSQEHSLNVNSSPDLNILNIENQNPLNEVPILDLLTDNEHQLINNCLDAEYLGAYVHEQTDMMGCDVLSEFL